MYFLESGPDTGFGGKHSCLAEAWRSVSIRVFSGFQFRVPLASASAVFYHFKVLCNAASINSVLVKSAKKQQPYLN